MDADKRPVLVWPTATRPVPAVRIPIVLCSVPCGYPPLHMGQKSMIQANRGQHLNIYIYTVCSRVDGSSMLSFSFSDLGYTLFHVISIERHKRKHVSRVTMSHSQ